MWRSKMRFAVYLEICFVNIYILKVNNRNTGKRREICSKLQRGKLSVAFGNAVVITNDLSSGDGKKIVVVSRFFK